MADPDHYHRRNMLDIDENGFVNDSENEDEEGEGEGEEIDE